VAQEEVRHQEQLLARIQSDFTNVSAAAVTAQTLAHKLQSRDHVINSLWSELSALRTVLTGGVAGGGSPTRPRTAGELTSPAALQPAPSLTPARSFIDQLRDPYGVGGGGGSPSKLAATASVVIAGAGGDAAPDWSDVVAQQRAISAATAARVTVSSLLSELASHKRRGAEGEVAAAEAARLRGALASTEATLADTSAKLEALRRVHAAAQVRPACVLPVTAHSKSGCLPAVCLHHHHHQQQHNQKQSSPSQN
jgi:hypothetical protein